MPRILPRLLAKIAQARESSISTEFISHPPRSRRPKTLYHPVHPHPDFREVRGDRSILLDEENPVMHREGWRRHKRMGPVLPGQRVPAGRRRASHRVNEGDADVRRAMSEEEMEWFADPWLRILSSPLRQCFVTKKYFPRDLLVRLAPASLPKHLWKPSSTIPEQTIIADGLEHHSYKTLKCKRGFYVSCRRETVVTLMERYLFKRFSPTLDMLPSAVDQVSHLLRVRVLQELELLIKTLSLSPSRPKRPQTPSPPHTHIPIINRLTRQDLRILLTTNSLPPEYADKGAIAVIIAPPVNKDPTTREVVKGDMGSLPPDDASPGRIQRKTMKSGFRPVSVLLDASPASTAVHCATTSEESSVESQSPSEESAPVVVTLERERLPLYHSTSLMPNPQHRVVLHSFLKRIVNMERNAAVAARHRRANNSSNSSQSSSESTESPSEASPSERASAQPSITQWNEDAKDGDRLSHAYLLCSDPRNLERADVVEVAKALWRVRMFEGEGWEGPVNGRLVIPEL